MTLLFLKKYIKTGLLLTILSSMLLLSFTLGRTYDQIKKNFTQIDFTCRILRPTLTSKVFTTDQEKECKIQEFLFLFKRNWFFSYYI